MMSDSSPVTLSIDPVALRQMLGELVQKEVASQLEGMPRNPVDAFSLVPILVNAIECDTQLTQTIRSVAKSVATDIVEDELDRYDPTDSRTARQAMADAAESAVTEYMDNLDDDEKGVTKEELKSALQNMVDSL